MQKYKLRQDSCGLNKPTKHPIASIGSNKSLLKQPTSNQNKSTLSVLNSSDVNHNKSLHHRNKSSKHIQSHTFTNNTHQNSVNIPANSNSHNNSKSNKKLQNQKKKSTGKKLTSINTQSKLLAETSHGRSSSQYQNLLAQPSNKNQVSKNYKNILKIRKQTKEHQPLNQHKEQGAGSKSHKDLKQHQNHQKSINVSSFKDLKKRKSKSRSKSKQFQNMNKKSNLSKKHLITEVSNMASQENIMNYANQKKTQGLKKVDKATKPHPKQKGVVIINEAPKGYKERILNEFDSEEYERVPFCMLKSSTNSQIQFSNNDQNTVKQLIKQQKITNKAYFYDGEADDVVFCKDTYQYGQEQIIRKQQSHKLSKRYSKMNLQLSSQCLNCLTEPDYTIQPKGIRHRYPSMNGDEQEIRSSKQTSQFSSKPEKSSSKMLLKFRKPTVSEQTMHKNATIIQKVWRGYMTRKLLQRFIQEQEIRLFEKMRQFDEMRKQMMSNEENDEDVEDESESENEKNKDQQENSVDKKINKSQQKPIKIVEQESVEQSHDNVNYQNNNAVQSSQHHQQINTSSVANGLDYQSQILPREDAETISFIVELNNIGSKHTYNQPSSLKPSNQSIDQVHYTSVQSIDHLSKVENIYYQYQGEESIIDEHPSDYVDESFKQGNQDELSVNRRQEQQYDQCEVGEIQQSQLKKPNLFACQQPESEKCNFFSNNEKDVSRSQSYQESSFNEPSSIFFRPTQHSRQISSIHKISASKAQGDSCVINDHQESYRMQESIGQGQHFQHIDVNMTGKTLNQEESSYYLGDETEGHIQNLSGPKEKTSNFHQNLFEKANEMSQNIEESYKIDDELSLLQKQRSSEKAPEMKNIVFQQNNTIEQMSTQQHLVIQSLIPNKSNPNILLIKSPKNQSLSKSYFSQSKGNTKVNEKQANENIKKASSLKQFFFKKSILGNEFLNEKQDVQLPILPFSSHKLNLLSFPTQKEASSIESLLHFRHQCLTHQHSIQFRQIQELYVKQKISKQDFILRLHQLASNFQEEALSIKQASKDIFNGYRALLKLIKDVLKDCKILGLSLEKGSNVRYCRSMEIFFREKDKISNQKCIFDDDYQWKFDDVMIDELQKSKFRVFSNSKSQRSEKSSQIVEIEKQGDKIQQWTIKNQVPESKEEKDQNKKQVTKNPFVEEKQLSRQSSSHHQLPQLILDNKGDKETSSLTLTKISPQKIENPLKKQRDVFVEPCSFDISELGLCDEDYFDDDEPSQQVYNRNKIAYKESLEAMRQSEMTLAVQDLNGSDSYDIDEESLIGVKEHQEQNVLLEKDNTQIGQLPNALPSYKEDGETHFEGVKQVHIKGHKRITQQQLFPCAQTQQISIRTIQLRAIPDIHLVIKNKNREFLEKENDQQDLLDSDDAEVIPAIKREVYQLSCDSDEDEGEIVDKWETQQEEMQVDLFTKEKRVDSPNACFNRMRSLSLYDQKVTEEQEESHFSKKYSSLADFVQQILLWQFIEDIIINKNKPQTKNSFGKKISEVAKKNVSSTQDEQWTNLNRSERNFEQDNVVIISNDQSNKKNKKKGADHMEKSTESSRESLSKISCQEINAFLRTLYQSFPTYDENKSKLIQRMYPSPIQLLRSLRDTSMEDYFDDSHKKRKLTSYENSENGQINENQHEFEEKSYSDHSNVDSETSYLELGSYEFLLSQQLCESLIEKYILEVYDIEMEKKLKTEREENAKIQTVKREFNEYLELKGIMASGNLSNKNESNIMSPSKLPKQGSFQSIIRTRELFLQHKEIQSLMLRKEILKIELHTILDSMNEELIKERESKNGYSGIGLSEIALGTIQRTGIEVKSQQEYGILVNKAKYRLQKFVLNQQVNLNDKLLLECQQSVTINDSQWIFYVTQALEFGLQIAKIIQEVLWEEAAREISKMQLKRKFRLDDCWAVVQRGKGAKEKSIMCEGEQRSLKRGKKVISINIVDSSQKEDSLKQKQQIPLIQQFNSNYQSQHQSSQSNHSESSSFEEESQNSQQEEDIIHYSLQKQFNQKRQLEIIQTVRNENTKNAGPKIASSSPIQDQGRLSNLNDSTSNFTYHFSRVQQNSNYQSYSCEFEESGILMSKFNDYSKIFNNSHAENNDGRNFYETHTQQVQIRTMNQDYEKPEEDNHSYELDEDSMQFDEQLDKELDEMNND